VRGPRCPSHRYSVSFAAAAPLDSSYDGLAVPTLAFSNLDIDAAGFVIVDTKSLELDATVRRSRRRGLFEAGQAEPLLTSEAGLSLKIDVVLTSLPAADVKLCGSSSDETEGTFGGACLTFTPATWDAPQSLTVMPVDDNLADGPIACVRASAVWWCRCARHALACLLETTSAVCTRRRGGAH
jgi:hypothetical protein